MPVVVCPKCSAELDLDTEDIGHRVECPGCLVTFVATRPVEKKPAPTTTEEPPVANEGGTSPPPDSAPPPEPPTPITVNQPPPLPPTQSPSEPAAPPPPERTSDRPSRRTGEPITLTCPACQGSVSVATDDLGHKVECPMCQQVFRAEDPDRRDGRRSSRRDDDDDAPGWRRSSRRSRYRDDDDDDRPRRRRRGPEDPYESPDPKAWVWQAKRDLATPGAGLEVLGWVDVAFGGMYILIGVLIGMANSGGGSVGWEVVAMTIGLGVSGIAMGGVKAFGGRNMKQVKNLRLSVIACVAACLPIYLLALGLIFFGPQYSLTCCPAVLTGPAYIIGIVFGIIAATKLFNRNVKKAFEVNRPQGDVDTV